MGKGVEGSSACSSRPLNRAPTRPNPPRPTPARAKVSVRGDAACALLGTVPFEYLAWTPGQRSEAIVCLTGRRVRAALVPPPGGGRDGSAPTPCAVAEGVLVLDDDGDGAEADGGGRAG